MTSAASDVQPFGHRCPTWAAAQRPSNVVKRSAAKWQHARPFRARREAMCRRASREPSHAEQRYQRRYQTAVRGRKRQRPSEEGLCESTICAACWLAPRPGLEPGTYGLTVPGNGIVWDLLIQIAFRIPFTDQQLTSIVVSGRLGPFPPKLAPDWHQISYGLWQEIKFRRPRRPSNRSTAARS